MKRNLYALGRLKSGEMNKTEAEYALHLEQRKRAGDILWYRFEGFTLKLASNRCRYTPDFAVMTSDGYLEMHEVKGFWTDDAKVKLKVAADSYPMKFLAVYKKPKRDGGGWRFEEF